MSKISHQSSATPKHREIKMSRVFAMPNKQPYKIPFVKKLFKKYVNGIRLDLFPYPYQKDALENIQSYRNDSLDCITLDPPYSNYQLKKEYSNKGLAMIKINRVYFNKLFKEIRRTIKPGGFLVSFGWNSKRTSGFEFREIILLNHGSLHNDTIITVQQKINHSLLAFNSKKELKNYD